MQVAFELHLNNIAKWHLVAIQWKAGSIPLLPGLPFLVSIIKAIRNIPLFLCELLFPQYHPLPSSLSVIPLQFHRMPR